MAPLSLSQPLTPKLQVPFPLPAPPNAQVLAQSQTGDGPREQADSRVSRGVLLRTRAKGVCFHIIAGQ